MKTLHKKCLSFNIESEPSGPLIAIFSVNMWLEGLSDGRIGKINLRRLIHPAAYKTLLRAVYSLYRSGKLAGMSERV